MSNKPTHKTTATLQQTVKWNYPVPPPEIFEKYKLLSPEIADQFVRQWEQEAEHRRDMERKTLALQNTDMKFSHLYDFLSLILSFAIILSLTGGAIYFALNKQSLEAIAAFIGALALFWKRKTDK